MHPIRTRNATGAELTFASREELENAIAAGRVQADGEVFHVRADRWLPITSHPAWPSVSGIKARSTPAPTRRSRELVLIYPDFTPSSDPAEAPAADPLASGPILAPEEIHRVLRSPRPSDPQAATGMAAGRGSRARVSGPQDRPLLEKAMPTFSRAFHVAAELVHVRL